MFLLVDLSNSEQKKSKKAFTGNCTTTLSCCFRYILVFKCTKQYSHFNSLVPCKTDQLFLGWSQTRGIRVAHETIVHFYMHFFFFEEQPSMCAVLFIKMVEVTACGVDAMLPKSTKSTSKP